MLHSPVAILGSALLTPLDTAALSTWEAIRAGREVVDRGVVADGVLDGDTESLDRLLRIGIRVGRNAVRAAGLSRDDVAALPIFAGTSKGPVLSMLAFADRHLDVDLARVLAAGPHALAEGVARALGTRATMHTSVAACASGLHALHRAVRAIQFGECERALVVAADASVHPLFEGSFDRLGVLAKPESDGHRRCRPWENSGFILSEAGAAMVLARSADNPLGWIEATRIAADGTHLITLDPEALSLRRCIREVVGNQSIDFVHAHATGTAHDAIERQVIADMCGDVQVFSSKRWLGHSLGAASLVAAVLSLECQRHRETLNGVKMSPQSRSITIAQGFGGHIAVLGMRGT